MLPGMCEVGFWSVKDGPRGRACDRPCQVRILANEPLHTLIATVRLRRQTAMPKQGNSPQVPHLSTAGGLTNDARLCCVTRRGRRELRGREIYSYKYLGSCRGHREALPRKFAYPRRPWPSPATV